MVQKSIASLNKVTKMIGRKKIVEDISFELYPGEVFGLIGPNGAGKTTIIRLLVGLMSISSGDIYIQGNSIQKNFSEAIRHVGAIVENPEMYKFMTGYQNLLHYANMVEGVSKDRIVECVKMVGLESRIHEKVGKYSLGMRQRLGLAQALLHAPKLLILDEPTNGLDPSGINELRQYIQTIAKKENVSILISSHLLTEIEAICDRIGIIQAGKLIGVHATEAFVQEKSERKVSLTIHNPQQAIACIQQYYPAAHFADDNHRIIVTLSYEAIPQLIQTLVNEKLEVFEVKLVSQSLEDRFLEVVGGVTIA